MLHVLALIACLCNDSSLVYRGNAGQLRVALPRLESAAIKVDGRVDELAWQDAALLTGFTQYEPHEGIPASQETEVRVFYASDAIYFGITAHDTEPHRIRATLVDRDRPASTDDWVRLLIDTFDDRRQAYAFYVNPYGIQSDGIWVDGRGTGTTGNVDFNPDFIWQSDARLNGAGWSAEVRIPYVSLRFPDAAVHTWGFNVGRATQRDGGKMSWAPWTTNHASFLGQSGKLVGLQGLRPQRLIELNPVTTGRRTGQVVDGVFGHTAYRQEFGLNARYGITQNVLLDATVNPDFSQIEADADQITANERFAISYPEKRPFFLEGADLFQTPHRLVYTRSIVEPAAGVKLTGKLGAFKAGYLGAYDDSPPGAPDNAEALVNLFRLRRDLGNASTIGLLYTDRTLRRNQGFNRVASVDARLVLAQRYTLNAQFAESWTRAESGTVNAPLWSAALLRSGRTFGFNTVLEGIDRDFQAQSGFIQRRGDARAFLQARTTFFNRPQSWIQKYEVAAQAEGFFDEDRIWSMNRPREGEIELHPGIYFRNNSNLRAILRIGYFQFDETDFAHWQRMLPDGTPAGYTPPLELRNLLGFALLPSLRPTQRIQIGGRMYLREVPIYGEASRGFEVQLAPQLRLWPSDGLTVELDYAYSRLRRTSNDSRFSSQDITRFKVQYQFSKALMARFFVQYNLNERDAIRDALEGRPVIIDGATSTTDKRTDFGGNLLLQYEPSPGTIFYLGYTRQMQGLERTYDYARLDPVSDGIFLKFSYLYRL